MSEIEAVTNVLETYVAIKNEQQSITTFFHTNKPPSIPIRQYLKRLEQYMKCSGPAYVMALIYLDRVTNKKEGLVLSNYCIHRLFLTSLVVAVKFYEDKYYKNSFYSKVGGISSTELNTLELEFLDFIDYTLYVSEEEYQTYSSTLMEYFSKKSSC
jgi:hypothetical protein